MSAKKIISIRIGPAHATVAAMAQAQSADPERAGVMGPVTPSDVYRDLLREALVARMRDCSRHHRGPVAAGSCGHCGATA